MALSSERELWNERLFREAHKPMSDSHHPTPSVAAQVLMYVSVALAMVGVSYNFDSVGPVAQLLSRQLGFSDLQIGSLNAVYSFPNMFMPLIGGVLIDRYRVRTVMLLMAAICVVGAAVTALDGRFSVMMGGRLLLGIGAETLYVTVNVALTRWFLGTRSFALLFAMSISLGRLGSYLADRSPSFARTLYDLGWQPPLWLAAGFAAVTLIGAVAYWMIDRYEAARGALAGVALRERIAWRNVLRFPAEYWYLVGLCVAFYSVIFPFRSTFAIKYFQETHGLTLEQASRTNSYVFMAAIFATPMFAFFVDRIGRHALLLVLGSLLLPVVFLCLGTDHVGLWIPTVLLGVSFSLVPAVLWPSITRYVTTEKLGTAYGLITMLQNTGLTLANLFVGHLNDRSLVSSSNAGGYSSMLWFFGVLSLAGLLFAALLRWRETLSQRRARIVIV